MMISPEGYYELKLKGKSQKELLKAIKDLKREIAILKKIIEENSDEQAAFIKPSLLTRIKCNRDYLDSAVMAYKDAGGEYCPSKAELKSCEFNESLEHLSGLMFSIGGFFGGYETRTYTVSGDDVLLDVEHTFIPKTSNFPICLPFSRHEFIEGLKDLHLGEWKLKYFDPGILDGTQWQLEIQYDDGRKPIKIIGSNSYPYNFDDLRAFLESDEEEL